jgi:hypothetical protein
MSTPVNAINPAQWGMTRGELIALTMEKEQIARQAQADVLNAIAVMDRQNTGQGYGTGTTEGLLEDILRITPTEASRRVKRARSFCGSLGMTGEPIEPKMSQIAEGMQHGDYDNSQLDAMNSILTKLPPHVDFEQRQQAEQNLAELAKQYSTRILNDAGRRIHAYLDPDGPAPSDKEDERPNRELHLQKGRDGRLSFRGSFDGETGDLLSEVLSPLAKPRPELNGVRDPRGAPQRNGDALAEALNLVAKCGELPVQGQEQPHITVTISWEMLRDTLGVGTTAHTGAMISPESARRMACDAKILPMVLDGKGVPLDLGRKKRLITPDLRTALNERDRGCAYHNCSRPPRWCEGHHIVHWADGGPTSLENCVLLCEFHHRMIHHGDWTVQMTDGRPEFVPPSYIDPERIPLQNTYHFDK